MLDWWLYRQWACHAHADTISKLNFAIVAYAVVVVGLLTLPL